MLHKKIKKIPRTEDRQNIIQEIPDESVHQKYQNLECEMKQYSKVHLKK